MIHISTSPVDDGLVCMFHTGTGLFEYHFRRIVVGLTFPNPQDHDRGTGYGIAVVVGERAFYSQDSKRPPERVYVVMDESDGVLASALFESLIGIKDKYRVSVVYCPSSPASLVEELKRQDGLTHYTQRVPGICRNLWPSFVSLSLTAGIYEVQQDSESMHRDIELLLNTTAKDPDTGEVMRFVTQDFKPLPRLVLPDNLPTQRTRTGIRQATPEICKALWYGLRGLEDSRGWRPKRQTEMAFQDGGISGY